MFPQIWIHSLEKHFQERSAELQIPRLRFASLGMTKGSVALPLTVVAGGVTQQVPPLRYPGFPVDLGGVGRSHAPFLKRKAHTRLCPVLRGRKSGYAPVGMTHFSQGKCQKRPEGWVSTVPTEVSSRPERTRISCHAALDRAACAPFS